MTKQTTQMIKGVAILIMIAHHFLVYDFGMGFSNTWVGIGSHFKICVGIYAVLSGYGYFFSKEKTLKYGLKKIWGLLQIYWISLFTLFIPAALYGGWKLNAKNLIINLFAFGPNLNWNAWYVYFFMFCMLTMPFIHKIFRFNLLVNLSIAVVVPYSIETAIHVLVPNYQEITVLQVLFDCMHYLSIYFVGYLMAQYNVISKLKIHWFVGLALMAAAVLLRMALRHINTFGFNMDIIYAPLFVVGGAKFLGGLKAKWLSVFSILGKFSTGMWFFHAVFFSTYVSDIFQPILLLVKQPVLMFLWLVLLSLAGAFIYEQILRGAEKLIHSIKRST